MRSKAMKTDEYYKFTKGFFEAFKWEVTALKNQTHTELLRYQFDDIDTEAIKTRWKYGTKLTVCS